MISHCQKLPRSFPTILLWSVVMHVMRCLRTISLSLGGYPALTLLMTIRRASLDQSKVLGNIVYHHGHLDRL